MDIEQYCGEVSALALQCEETQIAPHDLIETDGLRSPRIRDCMNMRRSLMTAQEEESLEGYLAIGLFRFARERSNRVALFAFCFEIQHALDLLGFQRQCEPYEQNRPLFRAAPVLLKHIRRRKGGSPDA